MIYKLHTFSKLLKIVYVVVGFALVLSGSCLLEDEKYGKWNKQAISLMWLRGQKMLSPLYACGGVDGTPSMQTLVPKILHSSSYKSDPVASI